jgi:hypothetical protein
MSMIEIDNGTYKWLTYNKVVFVKLEANFVADGYGRGYDNSKWIPVVPDCSFSIPVGRKDIRRKYSLCIVDKLLETVEEDGKATYSMSIHHANAYSVSDWTDLFNHYIERSKNPNDNYAFMPLLWFLVIIKWQQKQLEFALRLYKPEEPEFRFSILNILSKIGICLPLKKQEELKDILRGYLINYKEYLPAWIPEAVEIVKPDFDKVAETSLFALIDISAKNFFEQVENNQREPDVSSSNKLIKLYSWLSSDYGLDNYQFLIDVFPFMITPYRLQIVKRYLHDVRLKRTIFDPQLFAQFKDNKYGKLIRYRLCIVCPSKPIVLTVPLLCDCILTLYQSKGETFQKIDGLLDFAISHCDSNSPRVEFMMERYIPTCNQGAVCNRSSFEGFIDYQLICSIDNEVVKKHFYSFPKISENEYLVSPRSFYNDIESAKPLRMRIQPRKDVHIGIKYDIFGFWKELKSGLTESDLKDEYSHAFLEARKTFEEKETQEIYRRTKQSLETILGKENWRDDCFEVPFDAVLLENLKTVYFYKKNSESYSRGDNHFLTTLEVGNRYKPFCAPTLSSKNLSAIDLPFFWCRGKECFGNALTNQTIDSTTDWKHYTLYHLLEIIGFNVLEKTEAGYEPNEAVRIFLAIAYKAMRKFERLKCRECGHLLFPHTGDQFNRYNHFSCRNQACTEYNKAVYLNYCYQCKKGLIDSRDSKQCENGWYICPNCASCCDDEQFERLAQKHIIMKQPIPFSIQNMRGHGHNNKGLFFCPSCGNQLMQTSGFYCSRCQKSYNVRRNEK